MWKILLHFMVKFSSENVGVGHGDRILLSNLFIGICIGIGTYGPSILSCRKRIFPWQGRDCHNCWASSCIGRGTKTRNDSSHRYLLHGRVITCESHFRQGSSDLILTIIHHSDISSIQPWIRIWWSLIFQTSRHELITFFITNEFQIYSFGRNRVCFRYSFRMGNWVWTTLHETQLPPLWSLLGERMQAWGQVVEVYQGK
jgi:hypothetical protein